VLISEDREEAAFQRYRQGLPWPSMALTAETRPGPGRDFPFYEGLPIPQGCCNKKHTPQTARLPRLRVIDMHSWSIVDDEQSKHIASDVNARDVLPEIKASGWLGDKEATAQHAAIREAFATDCARLLDDALQKLPVDPEGRWPRGEAARLMSSFGTVRAVVSAREFSTLLAVDDLSLEEVRTASELKSELKRASELNRWHASSNEYEKGRNVHLQERAGAEPSWIDVFRLWDDASCTALQKFNMKQFNGDTHCRKWSSDWNVRLHKYVAADLIRRSSVQLAAS